MGKGVRSTHPLGRTDGSTWSRLGEACAMIADPELDRTYFFWDRRGTESKTRLSISIARKEADDVVNTLDDEGARRLFNWLGEMLHRGVDNGT